KGPPTDGFNTETELEQWPVADPALRSALLRSLHADPGQRNHGLRPLKRDLARWFVEHAGEEPLAQHNMSSAPPPLPESSVRPKARSKPRLAAPSLMRRKGRLPMLAAG